MIDFFPRSVAVCVCVCVSFHGNILSLLLTPIRPQGKYKDPIPCFSLSLPCLLLLTHYCPSPQTHSFYPALFSLPSHTASFLLLQQPASPVFPPGYIAPLFSSFHFRLIELHSPSSLRLPPHFSQTLLLPTADPDAASLLLLLGFS